MSALALVPVQTDSLPLSRRRYGRGFMYFNARNEKITDRDILKRIKALAIPPMWREVKICARPEGHIQAIGRDTKERKQYIYHPAWIKQRQIDKFGRLEAFGRGLPELRRFAHQHLQQSGWPREKVLALMLLVLDQTGIRIGNQAYLRRNQTHGLTTLRRRHLDLEGDALLFHFKGKSSKQREVRIEDEELIRFIQASAEQPGYEIFRYREKGQWQEVDSDDINSLIHSRMGEEFSSKDFRTWVAGRLSLELYPQAQEIVEDNPRRSFATTLIKLVSKELGNTPAVCRDHYLHPTLLEKIRQRNLPDVKKFDDDMDDHGLSAEEKAFLSIIK